MRIANGELEKQVQIVTDQLQALADGLANDGLVTASGVVLAGRQMIRLLWTQLGKVTDLPATDHPVTEPIAEPPEAAPVP